MKSEGECPKGTAYPSDCEITQGLLQRALARQDKEARGYAWRSCFIKAEPVTLLLLDVDGVLTDGTITYTQSGDESKSFHSHDGFGLRLIQEAGIEVGLITARTSEAVARRAQDLHLSHVYQGVRNKLEVFEKLKAEKKILDKHVAYIGDDWLDLPLLTRVGFSATVTDGVFEIRKVVDYVTKAKGGRGAVREVCELILEAKGKKKDLLEKYIR